MDHPKLRNYFLKYLGELKGQRPCKHLKEYLEQCILGYDFSLTIESKSKRAIFCWKNTVECSNLQ